MTVRHCRWVAVVALVTRSCLAGGVTSGSTAAAPAVWQVAAATELAAAIDRLGDFDYGTRTAAARALRRASGSEVVPALAVAVASHADGYVRYRALVLLTGFDDGLAGDVAFGLLDDPNDRLRGVAYAYFEHHADVAITPTLLAALEAEASEFVRPAIVRALASRGNEAGVQTALIREVDRGEDFFRSTVIEALGDYEAVYALDVLIRVAGQDGPLQDDAVVAIGKIGAPGALSALGAAQRGASRALRSSIAAASCLLGVDCPVQIGYLEDALRYASGQEAYQGELRSVCAGLGALAARGHAAALAVLLDGGHDAPERARAPIALALGTAALRNPAFVVSALGARSDRVRAIDLLVEAFDMFQEDYEEERFYAGLRRRYWAAEAGSAERALAEELINRLEF